MIDEKSPHVSGGGEIDLRLFGSSGLYIDNKAVSLGGTIPTGALVYLALNRERQVPASVLADKLRKGETDPPDAHVALWKLRRALKPLGLDHIVVNTPGAGFQLELADTCCDVFRFRAARAAAKQAAATGDHRKAAELFRRALEEGGRGAPLAGLPDFVFAVAERSQLEYELQACLEARIDADIKKDDTPSIDLISELSALTYDEVMRLREHLWTQLATVEYLNRRQAEALTTLRRARKTLLEVAGISPGPELLEIERKILNQEPLRLEPARPLPMPTTVARDTERTTGRLLLDNGRVFLVSKPAFTIGRHPDNDLEIEDAQASREHAKIVQSPIGLIIRDLDSTNGVFVDDERINQTAVIKDQTVIRIGTMTMVFHQD